jgi:hypothetical protein
MSTGPPSRRRLRETRDSRCTGTSGAKVTYVMLRLSEPTMRLAPRRLKELAPTAFRTPMNPGRYD